MFQRKQTPRQPDVIMWASSGVYFPALMDCSCKHKVEEKKQFGETVQNTDCKTLH